MNLQSLTNINVDFYDKKYILINAKQLDKGSRFLLVTCYNHGIPFSLDSASQSVYIRYKKADGYSVFNLCKINDDGKILIELTEQMLAVAGICVADLVIVNKRLVDIDEDSLEVSIKNAEVLSTMTFLVDVSEIAAENSEIESSYEYSGLNDTLAKANADYSNVIKWARSYATGDGGVRYNEETDNAKYYYKQSYENLLDANNSKKSAATSESNAETYMNKAEEYMEAAQDKALEINNKLDEMVEAFSPMGTITYAELKELHTNGTMSSGHLYNISDTFTTEDTPPFKLGVGVECAAGSNVYYVADGYWHILIGSSVAGVKGDAETSYRRGNINLTAENIGAISSSDIATTDEVKIYLGIN